MWLSALCRHRAPCGFTSVFWALQIKNAELSRGRGAHAKCTCRFPSSTSPKRLTEHMHRNTSDCRRDLARESQMSCRRRSELLRKWGKTNQNQKRNMINAWVWTQPGLAGLGEQSEVTSPILLLTCQIDTLCGQNITWQLQSHPRALGHNMEVFFVSIISVEVTVRSDYRESVFALCAEHRHTQSKQPWSFKGGRATPDLDRMY